MKKNFQLKVSTSMMGSCWGYYTICQECKACSGKIRKACAKETGRRLGGIMVGIQDEHELKNEK